MRHVCIAFVCIRNEADKGRIADKGHEHNEPHDESQEFRMRPRACPADEQVQVVKQEKAVEEDDINGTEDKG